MAFGLLLIVGEGGNSPGGTISAGLPFPRLFRPAQQLTGVEAVVDGHNAPSVVFLAADARPCQHPSANRNPTSEFEKWEIGTTSRSKTSDKGGTRTLDTYRTWCEALAHIPLVGS